jgi:hypothetical protein
MSLPPLMRLPRAFGEGIGSSASSTGAGRFRAHFARRFVLAHAFKGSLAHIAIAGPARELDLGDELRLDPGPILALARRTFAAEWIAIGLAGVELFEEPAELRPLKPVPTFPVCTRWLPRYTPTSSDRRLLALPLQPPTTTSWPPRHFDLCQVSVRPD